MRRDPARTTAQTIGFAVGFVILLMGGAGFAGIAVSLVLGELPPVRAVVGTSLSLGIPLAAFRSFDRKRKTETVDL